MADTELATQNTTTIRNKLLGEMSPELRASLDSIRGMLQAGQEAQLMLTWDLGDEVNRMVDNEATFGDRPVEKIAELLAIDGFPLLKPTSLYDAAEIAKIWTKPDIQKFAEDGIVTVQHLIELKRVTSSGTRAKLLKRIQAKRISAKQIRDEIGGQGVETNRKGGIRTSGRPLSLPISPQAGLKQASAFVSKGRKLNQTVWNSFVLDKLEHLSDSKITPKLLADVERLLADLEPYLSEMRLTQDRFRKLRQKLKTLKPATQAASATGAKPSGKAPTKPKVAATA